MSENIDGGLGFVATLDIKDFNVSAEAMERRIRRFSDATVDESARMEQSIVNFAQNGARYIIGTLVGGGMMGLANSIVQTRGQFQQLSIAFETMLGSGAKAQELMSQIVNTAAKTPFDLLGLAGGAKQLMAYGTAADKVNDTLVRLGNIASGLSIPLNDIVYLYGTTMVQGRLYAQDVRQFTGRGIPLVKELAAAYGKTAEEINAMVSEGKIGFPEVEKVINKMTDAGGQFYNLMEKQSKSLTGMVSNLGDAWDNALNKLGEQNQDVLAAGISGASTVVENLDEVLKIVKAIAIAYGSYKAAIVLNTLATKGYTGVALIDNTVRQAKIALMKADEAMTGKTAAITAKMTAAQEAHTLSLQKQLTVEEQSNLAKQLRITTIQQLLTAQQQEYLSNLGVTASSQNYEAVAMGVLSVEQRVALSKTDLSSKSAIYQAALEREVMAKNQNHAATLNALRTEVKASAARVEAAKASAIASMQATEAARYEVYWAKQSGDATRIATAEKRLEAAQENQAVARKGALAAQTDFHTKKKILESAATRQSTVASIADTAAKGAQTTATSLLSVVTTKCSLAVKALWASMMTNPVGWIIGIVGALVSVFTLFSRKQEEAKTVEGEFQDATKKAGDELRVFMAILKSTEAGTNTHKKALEKVNAICQEYNKTLLSENATLDEQKAKYVELTTAIQAATAEKIKAKYVEQAMADLAEKQANATSDLKKSASKASYYQMEEGVEYDGTVAIRASKIVEKTSNNIRMASEAVWDAVESMALEASEKLKGLTGSAYDQAFKEALNKISNSVKQSTGATDKEMEGFTKQLSAHLSTVTKSATDANVVIDKVNTQLKAFFSQDTTNKVPENVDYISMSFAELDKKAKDTQTEIDKINAKKVKVETDNTKITELLGVLNLVNTAIGGKTEKLNTEAGISARIKELKDERENVEINSKKYKELTKTIQSLEKKLPDNSKNSAENAAKKAEQLAEKQRQADIKAEQSRIEIMEDGYEKRKALLDLQHRETLNSIDKEIKDLEKARKEAGKPGLSSKEKEQFEDRKSNENTAYAKAQNKLFDGEIDYKKKQYDLYFKWVKNMGVDVANTQFSKLLEGGNSYKSYVENEIKKLQDKQKQGSLNEGETNNLIALNVQYDEITGAKTAMDVFRESVSQTIQRASTLAEKIQAIADAKDKLSSGSTGLVGDDEKAEASLFISNEEDNVNKEIQDKILGDFKTFEQQKLSIQNEYSLLRSNALAQNNADLLAQVNKGEAEALSALNASMLMQSESWNNLFSDLDSLTVDKIDSLIKEIQEKMGTADLKLNPADMKAVLDKLDQAKQRILDVNPFKAMGSAISSVFKKSGDGAKKSSTEIKRDWSNLADATEGCFDFVNDAISGCDVLSDLIGDSGKATMDMLQGVATAGIAMAAAIKTAETASVVLAAISIALSAIQWIASLFNNDDKLEKRIQNIQANIDDLSNSFDRLQNAMSKTYWVYNDDEKEAHEKRLNAINEQINALEDQAKVAKASWNFVEYAKLTKQIKELRYDLEKAEQTGDMFQLYELQQKNLLAQQDLIKQQIEAEKKKKKTDSNKIADWEEQLKDIDTQIKDMELQMLETLAGTDIKSAIDEFADALVDAYCKGEDAAIALGEVTKKTMKNAVVEALKRQYLAKGIEEATKYLGSAMGDGVLTDEERAKFESLVNTAGNEFNNMLNGIGDWIKDIPEDKDEDAMTGAVKSLSEETGGIISGRLNAVVINQSDSNSILRQSLTYHQQTAANTGASAQELKEIKETLNTIKNQNNGNSLLSQGLS